MKPETNEWEQFGMLEQWVQKSKERLLIERDQFFSTDFSNDPKTKKLSEFFIRRDLAIIDLQQSERSKEYYDVAKKIWSNRELLIPFIREIPRCTKTRSFDYSTSHLSQLEHNQVRNFCEYIKKQKGWFSYQDNKTSIHVDLSKGNGYIGFFNGGWAEQVCLYIIDKTLNAFTKEIKVRKKLFWNVKLKYFGSKHQHDMELDLVIQIRDNFYIFEVKSGTVLQIDKWVDRTRLFESELSKYITCTADPQLNPMTFAPFKLFALPTLGEQLHKLLSADFPG